MAGRLCAVADRAHGAKAVGALGVANGTGLREETVLVRLVDSRGAGEDERRVEPIEPQHVASPSLRCSCHSQLGVRTRSPGRIGSFSPSTVVDAPSPSMTKRSAAGVWRCARATSPGRTSWMAA